jgi:hypothetical protein
MPEYRNFYKRQDVFRCVHADHRRFAHVVSPWHVLREKGCFPEGCLSTLFRCALLMKGGRCPRRFRRAGPRCEPCPSLRDEKVMYRPMVALPEAEWRDFRAGLERFRFWLRGMEGRTVPFYGRVEAVKPCLHHIYDDRRSHLVFQGWIITFPDGWLGTDRLLDRFHLLLPKGRQRRLRLAPGDEVEGAALLDLPEGRMVLHHPVQLEAARKGEGTAPEEAGVLAGLRFGRAFRDQEERCFACPRGVLAHVVNTGGLPGLPRRELYCLEGYSSPAECAHGVFSRIALERCRHARGA